MTVRVSVQASPRDRESWLWLAAEVEAAGLDGLFVADHPGSGPAPFVALAAAGDRTALSLARGARGPDGRTGDDDQGAPRRLLRFAAEQADIVGVTGLGRTLADGHRHDVDWSSAGLRRILDIIGSASAATGRRPQIDALVQHVEITDDAEAAAQRLTTHVPGASVEDLLGAPFVWLGTVEEIRDELRAHAATLGVERYTVRAPAVADVRRILDDTIGNPNSGA